MITHSPRPRVFHDYASDHDMMTMISTWVTLSRDRRARARSPEGARPKLIATPVYMKARVIIRDAFLACALHLYIGIYLQYGDWMRIDHPALPCVKRKWEILILCIVRKKNWPRLRSLNNKSYYRARAYAFICEALTDGYMDFHCYIYSLLQMYICVCVCVQSTIFVAHVVRSKCSTRNQSHCNVCSCTQTRNSRGK